MRLLSKVPEHVLKLRVRRAQLPSGYRVTGTYAVDVCLAVDLGV